MSDQHIEEIAKAAGREAAKEVLIMLGINVSTPEGIQQAQRNFVFLDDLRTGVQAAKRKTIVTIVGSIITAGIAYATLLSSRH